MPTHPILATHPPTRLPADLPLQIRNCLAFQHRHQLGDQQETPLRPPQKRPLPRVQGRVRLLRRVLQLHVRDPAAAGDRGDAQHAQAVYGGVRCLAVPPRAFGWVGLTPCPKACYLQQPADQHNQASARPAPLACHPPLLPSQPLPHLPCCPSSPPLPRARWLLWLADQHHRGSAGGPPPFLIRGPRGLGPAAASGDAGGAAGLSVCSRGGFCHQEDREIRGGTDGEAALV